MKIKLLIFSLLINFVVFSQQNTSTKEEYSHHLFAGSKFFMGNDYYRAFSVGYAYSFGKLAIGGEFEYYDQQVAQVWFVGGFLKSVPFRWGRVGIFFQSGIQVPLNTISEYYDFTSLSILAGIKRYSRIGNNPAAIGASIGYDFRFKGGKTEYVLFPKINTVFFF